MSVVRWLQLVFFAAFVIWQILDRDRLRRVRARQRTWRETSRALSREDRRQVNQAIRQGRAVGDPGLAPAAVDLANAVLAGRLDRGPFLGFARAGLLVYFALPAVGVSLERRWPAAVGLWMLVGFLFAVSVLSSRFNERAAASLAANRGIPLPSQRSVPAEAPGPPGPSSTWACPHCGESTSNSFGVEQHYCGRCRHFCDDVT